MSQSDGLGIDRDQGLLFQGLDQIGQALGRGNRGIAVIDFTLRNSIICRIFAMICKQAKPGFFLLCLFWLGLLFRLGLLSQQLREVVAHPVEAKLSEEFHQL